MSKKLKRTFLEEKRDVVFRALGYGIYLNRAPLSLEQLHLVALQDIGFFSAILPLHQRQINPSLASLYIYTPPLT